MSVDQDILKQIVEAAIMASEVPLSVRQLQALFPEEARPERGQITDVLDAIDRESAGRGVELKKIGDGYRFQSREHLAPWLRKLNEGRPPRYSRALLETLAIVAYRQPVTRGDIEDIRGVSVSSEIMRTLQDREWIRQVGVRDVPGHPALYGTTPAFLAYFNLSSLSELPALIEQRDLAAIAREQNIELPFGDGEPDEVDDGDAEYEWQTDDPDVDEHAESKVSDPATGTVIDEDDEDDEDGTGSDDEGAGPRP